MHLQLTAAETAAQAASETRPSLADLAREGAQRLLASALQAEVSEYLQQHAEALDEAGHRLVVRNGNARERRLIIQGLPVSVQTPRVDDRREGHRFRSQILPPYVRRCQRLEEALPLLYLHGLSTGDIGPALAVLFGERAVGLSPTNLVRLKQCWEEEYQTWRGRDLSGSEYVYWWVDGVNFPIRLEEDRLTCLVVIGVRPDGQKEVVALEDGYREAQETWLYLLRDLKRRGLPAPALAVGDGALGFWAALAEVYPQTQRQRCWVHKLGNVLDKLPKRLQAQAKEQLRQIMYAPERAAAEAAADRFDRQWREKYPKAAACLAETREELLTFFAFPAAHWPHLRSTNPIESAFSTVKARTKRTKGAGSRTAGLAMAFKLLQCRQGRWRKVNRPELVAFVGQGMRFVDGRFATRKRAEKTPSAQEATPVRQSLIHNI